MTFPEAHGIEKISFQAVAQVYSSYIQSKLSLEDCMYLNMLI